MKNFMTKAIEIAKLSGSEVPVGAVVVKEGKIIAVAHNEKEKHNDVTAHAEILALKKAAEVLGNWRLEDCELYVTLEPCPMCAWAILQSRIKTLYFGSFDTQYGAMGSVLDLRKEARSGLKVYSGILEEECDNIINTFWEKKR
jgi:tRNA(adenine34) deaminase